MKIAVCLHGAAVVRASLPLHATDGSLVTLGQSLGAETVVLELVGTPGLAPRAINEAVALGASLPLRVVDEALGTTDAHATGLVMERILHELDPDLVLFSPPADPEGLADVPAAIAFRRVVPCVSDVVAVTVEPATSPEGRPHYVVRAQRGDRVVLLEVPRGALLGVQGWEPKAGSQAPAPSAVDTTIRVVTLPELGVDRVQVRRRNDLRGVIEPAARPLVTTRSVASLVSLLR